MTNEEDDPRTKLLNQIAGHKVFQLKTNFIPKCLVPLEQLFDRNDVPIKPTVKPESNNVDPHNLGTSDDPKCINLSRYLEEVDTNKDLDLFQEFKDVVPGPMKIEKHMTPPSSSIRYNLKKELSPHCTIGSKPSVARLLIS